MEISLARGLTMKFHRVTWKEAFIGFWAWLWRMCLSVNATITGCFVYALMNEKLQSFESQIYGTWKWDAFTVLYFSVLIGAIAWIWITWYKN
jgi:hypothetical protein